MNIIAVINGEQITREMLERAVGRYIVQLKEDEEIDFKPTRENYKFIKTEVLNFLMERILLLRRAEKEGVIISEKAVKERVKELRNNFQTAKGWEDNLAALKIDEEGLASEVQNDLIIEKYLDIKLGESMQFGEKELREYYIENEDMLKDPDLFTFYEVHTDSANEIKAVYILLEKYGGIKELGLELKKIGLAPHNHSDVPGNQLSEEIFNVLKDLELGKIAALESPEGGMTVLKLIKKIPGEKPDFDVIKEKLVEYLMHKARKENLDCVITEEIEKANIDYIDITYLEK